MANNHDGDPQDGETRYGSTREGVQGVVAVQSNGGADKPSILALDSVDDAGVVTTRYLWVDSTGDLRIGTTIPTNQDSDGTIVGSQS